MLANSYMYVCGAFFFTENDMPLVMVFFLDAPLLILTYYLRGLLLHRSIQFEM